MENSVVQRLTHPIIMCVAQFIADCVCRARVFLRGEISGVIRLVSVSSKLLYEFMYACYMVKYNQKHAHISNTLKNNVCINSRQKFSPYLTENMVCVHYEGQSVMLYGEIKDSFVADT